MRVLLMFVTAGLAGCASVQPTSSPTERIEFVVDGMTCDGCASQIEALLHENPDVVESKVDFDAKSGYAVVRKERAPFEAPAIQPRGRPFLDVWRALARSVHERYGFELRRPGEKVDEVPPSEAAKLDVEVIAHGEAVDESRHLVKGKYTIFDYYADWCGPCHVLDRHLKALAHENPKVGIRKIDIVDWNSEAAKKATKDFQMAGLPYVRIYDPEGRFLGAVTGNHIDKVKQLIGE